MKFEFKTENENFSKLFLNFFSVVFITALMIILCDASLKLGIISKYYEINYNCKLLSLDRSKRNFKKLSRLSNLKNKQLIWEFCREVVK